MPVHVGPPIATTLILFDNMGDIQYNNPRMYSRIIKLTVILVMLPMIFGVGLGYGLVNYLEIPDVKQLESYRPKSATRLYADDGTLFAELFVEKRIPIPLTEMPKHLRLAFVAIEEVDLANKVRDAAPSG